MYATILRNWSLWRVMSNRSSFGKTRLGETGRYKTIFVRYKSYHSKNCLNTNFNWFRYIFRIGEQYLIDQLVLHIGLYKKYQYKENEIGFYQNLEDLRVLKGLSTQDEALDYAIAFNEGLKAS